MKKEYKTPVSEKIVFDYTNTVVASGSTEKNQTKIDVCLVIKPTPCGIGVNDQDKCKR